MESTESCQRDDTTLAPLGSHLSFTAAAKFASTPFNKSKVTDISSERLNLSDINMPEEGSIPCSEKTENETSRSLNFSSTANQNGLSMDSMDDQDDMDDGNDEIDEIRDFVAKSIASIFDDVRVIKNDQKELQKELTEMRENLEKFTCEQKVLMTALAEEFKRTDEKNNREIGMKFCEMNKNISDVNAILANDAKKIESIEKKTKEEVDNLKVTLDSTISSKVVSMLHAFVNEGMAKIMHEPEQLPRLTLNNMDFGEEPSTHVGCEMEPPYINSTTNVSCEMGPPDMNSTPNMSCEMGPPNMNSTTDVSCEMGPPDINRSSNVSGEDISDESMMNSSTNINSEVEPPDMNSSEVDTYVGVTRKPEIETDGKSSTSGNADRSGGNQEERCTITEFENLPKDLQEELLPFHKNASMAMHSHLNIVQRAYVKSFIDRGEHITSNQDLAKEIIKRGKQQLIFKGDEQFDDKSLFQYLQRRLVYEKKKSKKRVSMEKLMESYRKK